MLQNVRLYKFPDSPLFFNQATLRFANFAHLGDFMNTVAGRWRSEPNPAPSLHPRPPAYSDTLELCLKGSFLQIQVGTILFAIHDLSIFNHRF
jgi:hypothetical protein